MKAFAILSLLALAVGWVIDTRRTITPLDPREAPLDEVCVQCYNLIREHEILELCSSEFDPGKKVSGDMEESNLRATIYRVSRVLNSIREKGMIPTKVFISSLAWKRVCTNSTVQMILARMVHGRMKNFLNMPDSRETRDLVREIQKEDHSAQFRNVVLLKELGLKSYKT